MRKYDTPEYRRERKRWGRIVEAGQAQCAEPVCVMPDRWIVPGSPWDLSHGKDGVTLIGASHHRCNRSEAAIRGNRMRRHGGAATWCSHPLCTHPEDCPGPAARWHL